MINTIMEAISIALDAEFGDGYETYIEEMSQDMDGHAFFIQCPNPTDRLFLGKRYFRQNQFCIQYFPLSEDDRNRECHTVGERLFSCLEYLEMDGSPVRGTNMKYEVIDGVLHFFVNYDMFVYRRGGPIPVMEEVAAETHVKG